mmetsp:Transcript_21847/g.74051  ORF Transcript_21847/g.74051 Transcript_21847/m.74051 type:complete len:213 (-) Transcript_21847:2171-2809(-)
MGGFDAEAPRSPRSQELCDCGGEGGGDVRHGGAHGEAVRLCAGVHLEADQAAHGNLFTAGVDRRSPKRSRPRENGAAGVVDALGQRDVEDVAEHGRRGCAGSVGARGRKRLETLQPRRGERGPARDEDVCQQRHGLQELCEDGREGQLESKVLLPDPEAQAVRRRLVVGPHALQRQLLRRRAAGGHLLRGRRQLEDEARRTGVERADDVGHG